MFRCRNMFRHRRNKMPYDLERGRCYRVESLNDPGCHVSQKLASLGIVRGSIIEVVNVAPLGDPIEIRSRGYNISLRQNELVLLNLVPAS